MFSRILTSALLLPVLLGLSSFRSDEIVKDNMCFNLENSVVAAYLKDAHAHYAEGIGRDGVSRLNMNVLGKDESPYMNQVVEQYDTPNWAELPASVPVPSKGGTTVQVADHPDFALSLVLPAEGDTTFVSNLIPQKVYWYRVLDASNEEISSGIFKTLGQIRMIKSRNVFNVRDIGGWPCDGGRLTYGKLFRSANLDNIATANDASYDIDVFTNNLGISVEMDLRSKRINSSPLGPKVKFYQKETHHYMYMLTNTYWSSSSSQVRSGAFYANLRYHLEKIVQNLQEDRRIIVHCSYGADRAGTLMLIIEALCGVSEADLVIDWELSSFTGKCYRKYIDQEELAYYYMNGDSLVKTHAEMRSLFWHLYENYGGKEGASLREQVEAWLKTKVYNSYSDKGSSIIEALRQQLIVPVVKSPTVVRDLSLEGRSNSYSTTFETSNISSSEPNQMVSALDASCFECDDYSTTNFIDCAGYSHLLVNVALRNVAAFYDAGQHFIGGIFDASKNEDSMDTSQGNTSQEYLIPAGAAYVKFNIPTDQRWTAVLSAGSILNPANRAEDVITVSPDLPTPSTDGWYMLDGSRLDSRPSSKGLYFHKGQKILIP